MRAISGLPTAEGLYDPSYEHDSCGVGFVAHLRGDRSHAIVRDGIALLTNLAHRGAVGADAQTGDGAGILIHIPHVLLRAECRVVDVSLPDAGAYGVGMCFLPTDCDARRRAESIVEARVADRGWRTLGWRDVPTNDNVLGHEARRTRPSIRQVFVAPATLALDVDDSHGLERELYVLRRVIERAALEEAPDGRLLYVASLSSRTIVYKGLLCAERLSSFYRDLADSRTQSGIALVHSRFATNTFPSWTRAHPYRALCHNGEINTLRGNLAWSRVREEQLASPRFGDAIHELLPIVQADQSDSASLDNVVELLVHAGRPIAHAMAMLVPRAWENDESLSAERRGFYEYHASLMEPWDGPAAMAFTDGRHIGALLDRNGLRPVRWLATDDDRVVLSSEAGALPIPAERIRAKGRLRPGTMLVVNTTQGKLLHDADIQQELASLRPYARWVSDQRIVLRSQRVEESESTFGDERLLSAFGYTREDMSMIVAPMAATGEEPLGSMGNDTPLAVLSHRPQSIYAYFRQLFAQVTNPAIDPIRERVVMSLAVNLGATGNVLDETPEHARQLRLEHPVIDEPTLRAIRGLETVALRSATLSTLFAVDRGPEELDRAVLRLCDAAATAARDGVSILVLSDRGVSPTLAAIPSLLAAGAVHHHLLREGSRSRTSIVCESGDVREVSQIALLFAYGASAVCPYLAMDACASLARDGVVTGTATEARARYVKAIEKGLLKILSKMGISTLQSYCGAQTWEAVGLSAALVDRHFTGTASRIGGAGIDRIAGDLLTTHSQAFAGAHHGLLEDRGDYHHRARGEHHNWSPRAIATLQRATREADAKTFREFSALVDDPNKGDVTLRSLLGFVEADAVPLADVESSAELVKRFATGAMSFGSISREAHETLAAAMNALGGRSNTGEGGEDPARFGTNVNSAIKQVASARFGVTTEYLVTASELQIKIAQGAKPGEGGQLPGHKSDATIARIRHATPGVTLISPPPHHDIYSIEDLKQLIHDLRCVNPSAAISVKLVAEAGVGTIAAGVAKAGADVIVIAGDSGGTGASPLSSIKRAGIPWEIGLSEAHQTLALNGLRDRVRLQVDGQLKTGRDVVVAALLGADEFGFATAPLIVEGCVMMRKCHLNTCPVGIATQDPRLREKFAGRPEHLVNYFFFVAEEVRELIARLGARSLAELVGRADLLRQRSNAAESVDLSPLLHVPRPFTKSTVARERSGSIAPLIELAGPALTDRRRVRVDLAIRNADRAVGADVAGEIARRFGATGLPDDSIVFRFTGSAGQSFGAFATRGLSLELEGEANDYVAKGLSGGRVSIRPSVTARVLASGTPIAGNAVLYGATSGELFLAGAAGERFAVRNSGALAVVEGVGDHACEYMTGGIVVILGDIGRNFAAGMSGGVVFVADESEAVRHQLSSRRQMNVEMVARSEHEQLLRQCVERHVRLTGSRRAKHMLAHWPEALRSFVRFVPVEYQQALSRQAAESSASLSAPRYG